MRAITGIYAGCYVPDVGETFEVTRTWEWRRWELRPFPWHRRHVHTETHDYRVNGWLRRRQPRPEPRTEHERMAREMIDRMIADDPALAPRVFGPDQVPLEWCHRQEAEYVGGVGVASTFQRICDVQVTGRVDWPERLFVQEREDANALAGEPLI